MASPTIYELSYDFTSFQSASPSTPLPADKFEIEFNNISTTTSEIISSMNLIQRNDGMLVNGIVSYDSLGDDVISLLASDFTPTGDWLTATNYVVGDIVNESNNSYVCAVDHSSGVFSTDLADGKWNILASSATLNSKITDISNITPSNGTFLVGDGVTWIAETGATLRTSIGVGTGDSPQFTGVNVGNASDTTITRTSTGVIAVGGSNVLMNSNLGTSVQAYSAKLQSISALSLVGDRLIYSTGANSFNVSALTAFARTLLDDNDAITARSTLDVCSKAETDSRSGGLSDIKFIDASGTWVKPINLSKAIVIVIGGGGEGENSGGITGVGGGTTSFGSHCSATGGQGGQSGAGQGGNGVDGDVNYNGEDGRAHPDGYGGAAPTIGLAVSTGTSDNSGADATNYGGGGAPFHSTISGVVGGGGGGGAMKTILAASLGATEIVTIGAGGSSNNGGDGFDGVVVVYEFT